jgi:hypothetical protein
LQHFQKVVKVNNHLRGENSPNLVTLVETDIPSKEGSPYSQCCQMVYFQTKNPNLGKIPKRSCNGRCWYFIIIVSVLQPNGIFYGHLVHLVVIWYIFPVLVYFSRFGIFFPFWYIVPRKIWQPRSQPRFTQQKVEQCLPKILKFFFFKKKEVARGGERTRILSISFIFSFSPLYR